jgi:hypothetical protein
MDKELSETNFAYEIGLHLGELKNRGFDSRPRLHPLFCVTYNDLS